MNKPIDYNLAKLCNEKGLPGVSHFYTCKKHYALNSNKYTFADLIMWLYEKHGIWVEVTQINENKLNFFSKITINSLTEDEEVNGQKWSSHNTEFINVGTFNTPTEAYIKAIEYVLTKLI